MKYKCYMSSLEGLNKGNDYESYTLESNEQFMEEYIMVTNSIIISIQIIYPKPLLSHELTIHFIILSI
jgi:hypothetical protein